MCARKKSLLIPTVRDDGGLMGIIFSEFCRVADKYRHSWTLLPIHWGYRNSTEWDRCKLQFVKNLRELGEAMNIRYADGAYYVFTGQIYDEVDVSVIKHAYFMFLEEMRLVCMLSDEGAFRMYFLETVRLYNPMKPLFDVIAFRNGVLDMRDFSFHDFSPEYHVSYMHQYDYDPSARCPMWQAFLRDVLPEKDSRLILQMFLGLGLIERKTAYSSAKNDDENASVELCLLLVGQGANGKSVIYNTAMGVFGRQRISGADYSELTSSGDEGMRARRLLRNCIFNWCSDMNVKGFGKNTAVFKRIVSGEPVTDRRLGHDVELNDRMPYLIFNINELPRSKDASLGFIRRLQYISFEKVIPKEQQNPALSFELMREYPGIFNWVVRGCRELKRRKFVFPESTNSMHQLRLTMLASSPMQAFLSCYGLRPVARVTGETAVWIPSQRIKDSVDAFVQLNGADSVSPQTMGSVMRSLGFTKRRAGEGMQYYVYGCDEEKLEYPIIIADETPAYGDRDFAGDSFIEDAD